VLAYFGILGMLAYFGILGVLAYFGILGMLAYFGILGVLAYIRLLANLPKLANKTHGMLANLPNFPIKRNYCSNVESRQMFSLGVLWKIIRCFLLS